MLLDNQEAVRALISGRTTSSQSNVKRFSELGKSLSGVEVRWIPGHSGIQGNHKSDELAKAALAASPSHHSPGEIQHVLTFAALKRKVATITQELVEKWWHKNRPFRYDDLDLLMRRKRPPELALPRWAYHRLIAARTGHGDFASYHRRFKHQDEKMLCKCGREKRPWHFAECRPAIQKWRTETQEPRPMIRDMIGQGGWQIFWRFLTVTHCYSRDES